MKKTKLAIGATVAALSIFTVQAAFAANDVTKQAKPNQTGIVKQVNQSTALIKVDVDVSTLNVKDIPLGKAIPVEGISLEAVDVDLSKVLEGAVEGKAVAVDGEINWANIKNGQNLKTSANAVSIEATDSKPNLKNVKEGRAKVVGKVSTELNKDVKTAAKK